MNSSPWSFLESVLDEQLHPGGIDASEELLEKASVGARSHVLDVGCGSGSTVELAANRAALAIGLDKRATGSRMIQGDFTAFPFADASFDIVVSECVLCLSPDLEKTISEFNRVLRSSGRLAIAGLVTERPLPQLPHVIENFLCLQRPRDEDRLCGEVTNAGFDIRTVHSHQDELIALRDTFRNRFDTERICDLLGLNTESVLAGIAELEGAIESGELKYISVIAEIDT